MHFRDPDARQSYSVPYAAFVTTNSTTQASQARTRISSEIDIDVRRDDCCWSSKSTMY